MKDTDEHEESPGSRDDRQSSSSAASDDESNDELGPKNQDPSALSDVELRLQARRIASRLFDVVERPTTLGRGRYHVLDVIGRGGMGCVYLARDTVLERQVAIKMVRTNGDAALEKALAEEARLLAKLSHPYVVQVHDLDTFQGHPFIVMEYIDGVTLQRWLAEKPRGHDEVVDVFLLAGEGLAAAHAIGLVHRDFKPSNVMLDDAGRVKVMDFGLANRDLGMDTTVPLGADETQPNIAAGTPRYMAPEQRRDRWCDARADQYAFCVALYEALYGEHPFGATSDEIATASARGQVRPARADSRVPSHLYHVLVRGLAPNPQRRFDSMPELLLAILDRGAVAERRVTLRVVFSPNYSFDEFNHRERERLQDLLRLVTRDPDLTIDQVYPGSIVLILSVTEWGVDTLRYSHARGECGARLGGVILDISTIEAVNLADRIVPPRPGPARAERGRGRAPHTDELLRIWQRLLVFIFTMGYAIFESILSRIDRDSVIIKSRVPQLLCRRILRSLSLSVIPEGHVRARPGPYVMIANHVSALDLLVVLAAFPSPVRVLTRRWTHWPLLGKYLRARGLVLESTSETPVPTTIRQAATEPDAWPLFVLLEGLQDHRRQQPHPILHELAAADLEFVPVILYGTDEAFGPGARCVRMGRLLHMVVLPAVDPNAVGVNAACEKVEQLIFQPYRPLHAEATFPDRAAPKHPRGTARENRLIVASHDGHYTLISQCGVDGLSREYIANHSVFKGRFMFKLLPLDVEKIKNAAACEAFMSSARLWMQLRHPAIVSGVEMGLTDGGEPFFVTQWDDPICLADLLRSPGVHLPIEIVVYITYRLLQALSYVHDFSTGDAVGLVHGIISPDCVLLFASGDVKLTDFDNCTLIGAPRKRPEPYNPAYVAPEVFYHQTVTQTIDLFSVGAVLYQLLEGRSIREDLFSVAKTTEGPLAEVIKQQAPPKLTRERTLPRPVVKLVYGLLQPDPSQRVGSARQALEMLGRYSVTPHTVTTLAELVARYKDSR